MKDEVKSYYVAYFDYDIDGYVKDSENMGLDNAKLLIASKRKEWIDDEWVVLAVMDI